MDIKSNVLSIIRTLLTLVGSYLVGHAILGYNLSNEVIQVIIGAVMTIVSIGWGIADKTATIEQVQSAVRSAIIAIGGLFVAAGKINNDTLTSILGLIAPVLTSIQSATSKAKIVGLSNGSLQHQVDAKTGKPTGLVEKATPKVASVLLLICMCACVHAQSPFQPLPRYQAAKKPMFAHSLGPSVTKTDSIYNAGRFGVDISPAGFTLAGVYQASAGVEYGFQHLDYNYSTQRTIVLWSASAVWVPINTATKINSIKDIATFGALVGIKNNLLKIGPFYNPNATASLKISSGFGSL